MSRYRLSALIYGILGIALMLFGFILHVKNDPFGIWPYVVGALFVSKSDTMLVWDHITKEEK